MCITAGEFSNAGSLSGARRRFAPSLAKSKSDVKRSGRFDDLPLSRTNEPVDGTLHSISVDARSWPRAAEPGGPPV